MAEKKVLVDVIKDGDIDGTSYEKGTSAQLTPFQAQCGVDAGMLRYAKSEPVPAPKTAARKAVRKRSTK